MLRGTAQLHFGFSGLPPCVSHGRALLSGAVLGLLVLSVSCRGERDVAERSEAAAIARAIELARNAPREARAPFVEALASAPCSGDATCTARKVCVDAYSLERTAGEALRAVRHAVAADASIPSGAGELLLRAERDLAQARELTRDCADREAELRRRYEIR